MRNNTTAQAKVRRFFENYAPVHLKKGDLLIREGQDPSAIFYLQTGHVGQCDISKNGNKLVVNVFGPESYFPMSWALNHTANRYFYESLEPCIVRKAPPQAVVDFIQGNPDVTFDLLQRLYSGVDGILYRSVLLMEGTAQSRLLFEMYIACLRQGTQNDDGTWFVNVSEGDLASRTGLARETVNREFQKIKALKLISVVAGGFLISQIEQLEALMGTLF